MSQGPAAGAVAREAVWAAADALLQQAGVAKPPTPLAELLAVPGLETEQFALTDPYSDRGLPVPLARARADLRPQVRGMVDTAGRVIYTHRMLLPAQRRFVTLHELGHFVLPWHHALLQACSEADLSPAARQVWEQEANLFAERCLFQGTGFTAAARAAPFGWASARRLAWRYEASLEASARRFVISRPEAALLLVAALREEVSGSGTATSGAPLLQVRYAVASPAARQAFGPAGLPAAGTPLPWAHPATRLYLAGGGPVLRATLDGPLHTGTGPPLQAELLSNGYEVLMLARVGAA